MQNLKNIINLAACSSGTGNGSTTTVTSLLLSKTSTNSKQLHRRLTTASIKSNKNDSIINNSLNKEYKRTIKTATTGGNNHISSRQQSTSQTNLAASQVAGLKKEASAGLAEEDEDYEQLQVEKDEQFSEQEDNLIYDKLMLSNVDTNIDAHKFVKRHIGPREHDIQTMLDDLDYKNLDELIEDTIPNQIRFYKSLNLPEALNENDLLLELKHLASMNESVNWKSYIGLGYYDCITPPVILRNMFENPGWTTAYTAYQAEIAQGRLESLMNYQTMIKDLTGLDVANASLLDESTAAAEALQVCMRHTKSKRNKFLISVHCYPQTKAVVETRAKALDIDIDYFDELSNNNSVKKLSDCKLDEYCGALIQYPNCQGHLYDLNDITKPCHDADCLVVAATDLMACTLFKPPGDFEHPADLAIGSSQRFGVPLNFGGPHAGFLACKQKLVRSIPGRVVGLTRDSNGNQAYRFALQTREQHIRRDKATSNICTAQALLANMSAMYGVYHGPEGLKQIANSIHSKTSLLSHLIKQTSDKSIDIVNDNCFFDTLTIKLENKNDLSDLKSKAQQMKINLRYDNQNKSVSISLDETTKLIDIFKLASLFNRKQNQQINNNNNNNNDSYVAPINGQLKNLKRDSVFLTHPVFNSHRSEAQLVRYMKSLENKDISLTHSMIPLGSCTMKLNATSQMIASSWPEFSKCHPFQPTDQCQGYMKLFQELDKYLCEITGYDRISFQPNSGAQGEYAGLRVIKSYLESIGQSERNVCLIPISAHGTNPASAQMAGFEIKTIKVNEDGNIDLDDLKKNIDKYHNQLACLMITYPSTFGVFEDNVKEVCDLIHQAGGQVYLDGANMNAQVGLCRPGDYGSDVSHLNLHKTFCIPHGGGGPGAGPIGVKKHLIPFLPSHPLISNQEQTAGTYITNDNNNNLEEERPKEDSFGTVSSSMWGSPAILPISWSYIRMMSKDLKLSSQIAILNANYMRKKLEQAYKILFTGVKGNVAHEFIIDCRPFKKTTNIEAVDIAKRLQDFGFHAPTVSWPVSNTLMLEPTESEDKEQLDNYCEALLTIRQEIKDIEEGKLDKLNNPIKNAPHTQQIVCSSDWNRPYTREQAAFPAKFVTPISKVWPTVGRVDDTYGDTNLFCSCPPPEQLM